MDDANTGRRSGGVGRTTPVDPRVTAVSVDPGICETALRPLYGPGGVTPAEGAAYVARLCDPAFEIVNGAYHDRGERMEPAAGATAERTVKRLNELADQLVGRFARQGPRAFPAGAARFPGRPRSPFLP